MKWRKRNLDIEANVAGVERKYPSFRQFTDLKLSLETMLKLHLQKRKVML